MDDYTIDTDDEFEGAMEVEEDPIEHEVRGVVYKNFKNPVGGSTSSGIETPTQYIENISTLK